MKILQIVIIFLLNCIIIINLFNTNKSQNDLKKNFNKLYYLKKSNFLFNRMNTR